MLATTENYLLSFSSRASLSKLLSRGPARTACMDGIRFWSAIWILVLHSYQYSGTPSMLPTINVVEKYTVVSERRGDAVLSGTLCTLYHFTNF